MKKRYWFGGLGVILAQLAIGASYAYAHPFQALPPRPATG